MTRETIIPRQALPVELQNADCVEFLFGHSNWSEARARVKRGGGYNHVSLLEPLEEGDIVFAGIGPNTIHIATVQGGYIVGKENRNGDVIAEDLDDLRSEGLQVQIYRRNTNLLTRSNDPFHLD